MKAVPSIISVYRITSYGKKILLTRVLLWICVDILPDILALKQPAPPKKLSIILFLFGCGLLFHLVFSLK